MENLLDRSEESNNSSSNSTKLAKLEMENKEMRDQFNAQRARMKELFLQKENECKKLSNEVSQLNLELNEAKSRIAVDHFNRSECQDQDRRAQEEIASLQKLVHETIEESSYSKMEIERLLDELEKLKFENIRLHGIINSIQQDSPSLAPVLSHVKKKIAKTLGADSGSNDYLEDSMRKAQEDAEVLRSLVVPLEEEIKVLKEKLRNCDDQLQSYRGGGSGGSTNTTESALVGLIKEHQATTTIPSLSTSLSTTDSTSIPICLQCNHLQNQLTTTAKDYELCQHKCDLQQREIDRYKEQLKKDGELYTVLKKQWQDKLETQKNEVDTLNEKVTISERKFAELQQLFTDVKENIGQQLLTLSTERENVHRHLDTLQNDNDFLAGKYLATSEELQNQRIDLPNTVEELQVLLLKCHESLIEARVGCEYEQRKCVYYSDETQVLNDQLAANYNELLHFKKETAMRIKTLESQVKHLEGERERLASIKETFDKKEANFQRQISEKRVEIIELRDAKEKYEKHNNDLKLKVSVMQQELGNSEAVQQDFVRLSQSLQMELEKIRAADSCVRWQDDEDIEKCPSCKHSFAVTRRKQHCRHCGTIYCEKCLTKSVPSGQRKKPARVCDVCHTLLVRNTAPYFSQAPPHSPT